MKNKKLDLPVTRGEFIKEISKLATKNDLKNFASKDDLKNFATKDDFNKLAIEIVQIKSELKTFATKEDLNNMKSEIINFIDAFARKTENYDQKALFHSSRIDNHEERITKLEKVA